MVLAVLFSSAATVKRVQPLCVPELLPSNPGQSIKSPDLEASLDMYVVVVLPRSDRVFGDEGVMVNASAHALALSVTFESLARASNLVADVACHVVVADGTACSSAVTHASQPALSLESAVEAVLRRYQHTFASVIFVRRRGNCGGDKTTATSSNGSPRVHLSSPSIIDPHLAMYAGLAHVCQDHRCSKGSGFSAPAVVVVRSGAVLASDALLFFRLCFQLVNLQDFPVDKESCAVPVVSPEHRILLATASWSLEDHHPSLEWRFATPLQDRFKRYDSKLSSKIIHRLPFHRHARLFFHAWFLSAEAVDRLLGVLSVAAEQVDQMARNSQTSSSKHVSQLPYAVRAYCDSVSLGRFVSAVLEGPGSFFVGPERMRAQLHSESAGLFVDPDDTDRHPPPASDEPVSDPQFPMVVDQLLPFELGTPSTWQQFRALFPQFRCPDRVYCALPSNSLKCGSFRRPTCFDGSFRRPRLKCRLCNAATFDLVQEKCNHDFASCCNNKCTVETPFFA